jgi:predicted ATP-dependent serine protease
MTSTDTKAHDFGALDATPADPILASHLTSDEELDKVLEGVHNDGFRKQKERLETGVKNLDDALSGGIVAGRVVGISGDVGKGASEVTRTHLLTAKMK